MTVKEEKKKLRKDILEHIRLLENNYTASADRMIVSQLLTLEEYKHARTVFCFVGSEQEIDTMPFLEHVLCDRKTLAVPLCIKKGIMEARVITSLEELERGYYGLLEPGADTPVVPPKQIDLAVIPCVSCSHTGARLGHGGGFYDIYFRSYPEIPTVMICRERVMCEDIPREEHDLIFPVVLSENGIYRNCNDKKEFEKNETYLEETPEAD